VRIYGSHLKSYFIPSPGTIQWLSIVGACELEPVCVMHSSDFASRDIVHMRAPIIAFNVRNRRGAWVSNTDFERLASVKNIHIRNGGPCNPGGVATSSKLELQEMRRNFSAGFRCGVETNIYVYVWKPTSIFRESLGPMSTKNDVEAFISFAREFCTE